MSRTVARMMAAAPLALILGLASTPPGLAAAADGDPVAFELCTPEGSGAEAKCAALGSPPGTLPPAYQVPHRRRLIIEQVSGDCGSDAASGLPLLPTIVAQTAGLVAAHLIIGVPNPPPLPGGLIPLTRTKIYADSDSLVTIGLNGVPGVDGRFCRVVFSGRLVR